MDDDLDTHSYVLYCAAIGVLCLLFKISILPQNNLEWYDWLLLMQQAAAGGAQQSREHGGRRERVEENFTPPS